MKTRTQQLMSRLSGWVVVTLLAGGLAATSAVAAVTAPYFNNFNNGPSSASDFVNTIQTYGTGSWSVQTVGGTNGVYEDDITIGDGYNNYETGVDNAALQVANMDGVTNWIEAVDVTVVSQDVFQLANGLVALGNQEAFDKSYPGTAYYVASFESGGYFDPSEMTITYVNGNDTNTWNGFGLASTNFPAKPTTNTTYHLTFSGAYDTNANLTLTFTVTDGIHSATLTAPPIAPTSIVFSVTEYLAGPYFGLQDYSANDSAIENASVQYDNYALAPVVIQGIPVPSTVGKAVGISWFGSNNVPYYVQSTTKLGTNANWSTLSGSSVTGSGNTNTVYDLIGSATQKFYQVIGMH